MKRIPQLNKEIVQIIEDSICKSYNMSPMDKSRQVYADVEIRFRRMTKLHVKDLIKHSIRCNCDVCEWIKRK